MTDEERWEFDLGAMYAFGFDSEDVDFALEQAGFVPDQKETYTVEQARKACRALLAKKEGA